MYNFLLHLNRYLVYYVFMLEKQYTVYPRISPLGAFLFFIFLDGGLFEGGGGLFEGRGYKIILDIKKTLLKYLVYFSRNFFMGI